MTLMLMYLEWLLKHKVKYINPLQKGQPVAEAKNSGWSQSLAEGRQEVIDDDKYNETVEIVTQEEATAESDKFQSTISPIKLSPKTQES